jgi:hypothetical protein
MSRGWVAESWPICDGEQKHPRPYRQTDVCHPAFSHYQHRIRSLMELSPSWEVANSAATQELPSILWNPKVHYRVHKSRPCVPILRQINLIHNTHPLSLRSILILSTRLHLGLSSGLFPSGFPTNILWSPGNNLSSTLLCYDTDHIK